MRPIIAILTATVVFATASAADARPPACAGLISDGQQPIAVKIRRGTATCTTAKRVRAPT